MRVKHVEEYRDRRIAQRLIAQIHAVSRRPVRLMEVCGTHTMAIFRSGLRALLPETITLVSGPGCPVCVTAQREIDQFVALARCEGVILTTFGDLLRVPGSGSSLQQARAAGCDVRVVYSPLDALALAAQNPAQKVVFLGVGFETTAPTVAAALLSARARGVSNFLVFAAHKRTPPAVAALMAAPDLRVDGFLLPGHVCLVAGTRAFQPLVDRYRIPCVVGGFEPVDLLRALARLVAQIEAGEALLENAYERAVTVAGNAKARAAMAAVFADVDAEWRGLGVIPGSGLKIAAAHRALDAEASFDLSVPDVPEPRGCACGEVLKGIKLPTDCVLYQKACTPLHPVGPCMVSSEGTCAAYFRYHRGQDA
ncbi:MAG TPA: hydrogenase formation protein HypD [Desulfobacterales bacterium]|jgi:hydrogenase expression/formation protein HypD|nr:hydrogenase formation protein HypD [Desulfobacterales bacterium]